VKSKLNPVPAAKRTQEKINNLKDNYVELKREEAQKLVTGIYELDAKVKLKDSQIVTITKQKSDLQQLVTVKTSEVQSKNNLLVQKEQLLVQKEKLLTELKIREENQLKEEYISVLHQLNPKVYSANYEDWSGKAQGAKDIIDQGNFTKIKKNLPVHKQQLAQKIETEKLALAVKEAEKLDKAKEEAVSILHQLHPHAYPVNYEDWPTHIKARKLLDSGNLQAIEKNLVIYRELLKKELARQKEEVQNKDQLILQKEQDLKSLNDTFTTTLSTKEEEIAKEKLKNTEVSHKVKKVSRKLAQEIQNKNQLALQKEMEEKLRIEQEQEIERLREQLALKESETEELLTQKELENQEKERLREELARKEFEAQEKDALLLAKELEKQEALIQKENELLAQKEEAVHNKSAEKNRIIEEQANSLLTKDEVIVSKDLKIGEVSQSVKKANRKLAAKDKLLIDKEQKLKLLIEQNRIEKEELLAQKELSIANKSHMKNQIIDELEEEINLQEDEVGNLRIQNLEKELMNQKQEKLLIQKDIELENLLEQKDEEVRNKSLAKNQIIGGLRESMTEKEKEAYKLQIELLMKQVEFHKKESELKDKALEDERLINELKVKEAQDASLINRIKAKELDDLIVIQELKGKLLDLKALYGHDISFSNQLSAIQFQAEDSIANNDFGAIGDLSKYISELLNAEKENSASLDISNLLGNLSPIVHGGENHVQNPLAAINNFDINHINTTHSVYPSGEGSSFDIIQEESLN
jgi:hypothetical protein